MADGTVEEDCGHLPSMSVLIPTYGRPDGVVRVVADVLEQPAVDEVVVVVDGRVDDTYERLCAMAMRDPRLRPRQIDNSGQQIARQTALEQAVGDVVLLLDDDVRPGPGLVLGHARRQAAGPGTVVVGYMPTRLPSRRRRGQFATYLYQAEYMARTARFRADPRSILTHLWGGNVSLWRSDALAVGLVSPGLERLRHSDQDLGLRCRAHGLGAVFDPALRATHEHERSLDQFVRDSRSQGASRAVLQQRHGATAEIQAAADGLPPPFRALVRLCRVRVVDAAVTVAMKGLVRACGVARLWRAEEAGARLLRRIALQRGALDHAERSRSW